jgi:high-affinity iron transporter
LEAVIFVGGVSLGQPATSIPIAAIVGLVCGITCGFLIYTFASRFGKSLNFFFQKKKKKKTKPSLLALSIFLIVMTNLLLLIGAGLFSKACGSFETHHFNALLGMDVDDATKAGDGPGSYNVHGNVWHLDCCNPEDNVHGGGWLIFGAIFGWTNNATR